MAVQIADAQLALVDNWISGKIACRLEATAEALHASTNAMVRALCRDGRLGVGANAGLPRALVRATVGDG